MKKHGFTLAEVLITLGIVGVISAMVIPTFTTRMQTAKIGPKLAKAKAAFEQATIAILDDAQSDSLSGVDNGAAIADAASFLHLLETHMKGSISGESFVSADGASYSGFSFSTGDEGLPHQRVIASEVMIDINGELEPDKPARDQFFFKMMDDGSLQPFGAGGAWKTSCPANATLSGEGVNSKDCAGHVLENGLRVDYR